MPPSLKAKRRFDLFIGKKAAKTLFPNATERIIEVGNEWGIMLDHAVGYPLQSLTAPGHPGKLVKLAFGQWNTHSKKSDSATPYLQALEQNTLHAPSWRLPL